MTQNQVDQYALLDGGEIYVLRYDLNRLAAVAGPLETQEVTAANLASGFAGLDSQEAQENVQWGTHRVWHPLQPPYPGDQSKEPRL